MTEIHKFNHIQLKNPQVSSKLQLLINLGVR